MNKNSAAQHENFSEVDYFLEIIKKEREKRQKQKREREKYAAKYISGTLSMVFIWDKSSLQWAAVASQQF